MLKFTGFVTFLNWQSFMETSNFLHLSSKKQRRMSEWDECDFSSILSWSSLSTLTNILLTVALSCCFNELLTDMLKSLLGHWLRCCLGLPSIFEAIYIFLSSPISEACNLSPLKRTATLYRSHEMWARILVITILQHGAKSIDLCGLLNAFASV